MDRALALAERWGGPAALSLRNEAAQGEHKLPVLVDNPELAGPLAALDCAFRFAAQTGASHVMLVGCDMPFLPYDLPACLARAIGEAGAAIPVTPDRLQVMAGLWRVDRSALEAYCATGQRALWRFARAQGVAEISWPELRGEDPFFDVDDEQALAQAERRLAHSAGAHGKGLLLARTPARINRKLPQPSTIQSE